LDQLGACSRAARSCVETIEPNRNAAGGNRRQLETTRTGVFAIGDVRSGSIKRVAAAVGEGAQVMAALHRYLTDDQDAAVAISHQFGG
jgi:thioredoxin reductase